MDVATDRPELAHSGAPSALRAVAMRRAGASDRLVVAQSVTQGAGRAAYAAVNMQRGAFIAMYSGRWRYTGEAAPYYLRPVEDVKSASRGQNYH